MPAHRPHGSVQPGIDWGPFTLRIPFLHLRPQAPELIQGLLVSSATGLAVVPLYIEHFGMAFETAIAMVVVQSLIICSAFLLFGDPFCPGWLTPALPLVLRETLGFETIEERIDFVNALVLLTAAIFLVFGVTRFGKLLLRAVPRILKASIILGAGMAAIYGEFLPRSGGAPSRLEAHGVSILAAVGLTLLLMFSEPLERWKKRFPWLRSMAALGLAPGFFLAMVIGPLVGEISYASFLAYSGEIAFWPDFAGLFHDYGVLGRGLPELAMFARAAPLASAAYIIAFGDLITGTAIVEEAAAERPDEKIPLDERRTHLTLGLRNAGMALAGGPFFPLQGPLWTGAMIVVAERYRRGRPAMDSLFDGVASYYFFGVPFFYFIRPVLELFRPLMDVALSLTLILTGFACSYVALSSPRGRIERGLILVVAITIMYFSMLTGLAVGFALTAALLGKRAWD